MSTPERKPCKRCCGGNELPQGYHCDNPACERYYKRAKAVGVEAPEDSRIVGLLRMYGEEKARAEKAEAALTLERARADRAEGECREARESVFNLHDSLACEMGACRTCLKLFKWFPDRIHPNEPRKELIDAARAQPIEGKGGDRGKH